jgi:hypothetical protein
MDMDQTGSLQRHGTSALSCLLTQLADALTLQGVSCCIRSGHAAKKSEMCRFWRPANLHLTKFNTSEYALDKRIYHIRQA